METSRSARCAGCGRSHIDEQWRKQGAVEVEAREASARLELIDETVGGLDRSIEKNQLLIESLGGSLSR